MANKWRLLHRNSVMKRVTFFLIPLILILAASGIQSVVAQPVVLTSCAEQHNDANDQIECTRKKLLHVIHRSVIYPEELRKNVISGRCVLGVSFDTSGLLNFDVFGSSGQVFIKAFEPVLQELQDLKFVIRNGERLSFAIPTKFILEGISGQSPAVRWDSVTYPSIIDGPEVTVVGYVAADENTKTDLPQDKMEHHKAIPSPPAAKPLSSLSSLLSDNRLDEKIPGATFGDLDQRHNIYVFDADHKLLYHKIVSTQQLDAMKQNDIASMHVLKGPASMAKHGKEKTIEIYLKSKSAAWTPSAESKNGSDLPLSIADPNAKIRQDSGQKIEPLVVVFDHTGNRLPIIPDISELNPDDVDRLNVLKGEAALEKYGDAATHGVVEIYLKQNQNFDNEAQGSPINIQIFPNPTQHELHIRFTSQKKSKIRYSVIDVFGKTVIPLQSIEVNGMADQEIDIRHLPSGQYFINAEALGQWQQEPFQIQP